jgi:hypothetical protein
MPTMLVANWPCSLCPCLMWWATSCVLWSSLPCRCSHPSSLSLCGPAWHTEPPSPNREPPCQRHGSNRLPAAMWYLPACSKREFFAVLSDMLDLEEQFQLAGDKESVAVVRDAQVAWVEGRYEEWEQSRLHQAATRSSDSDDPQLGGLALTA